MPLSDATCRNAKPLDKRYKLSDGRNLYLIIHPAGNKYWSGAYRFDGKQKSLSIGVYPDVPLAQAREEWDDARKQIKAGIDPSAAKQEAKSNRLTAAQQTFELTAREWHHVRRNDWSKSTADETLHRLEVDIFPEIGGNPVSTITPRQILNALRKIEARGSLEMSSRVRGTVSRIFNFGIASSYCANNPAAPLKDVLKTPVKGHFASITVEEMPELVRTLWHSPDRMFIATRVALWLMMRTFIRTEEIIAVPWEELNLDKALWIIPAARMKKNRDHLVPLSYQAVALFREMLPLTGKNYYVFPNKRRPKDHMSDGAVLNVLKRHGYAGKMTGHGFRSLAMGAIKQELGYAHEIVDLQLAHVKANKVDAAYDRAKFLAERTRMMQDWSDYIDKLARTPADSAPIIDTQFER